MNIANELPLPRLHQLFALDEERWILIWKHRPLSDFKSAPAGKKWNARFAGSPAGHKSKQGYTVICVDYKKFRAHRLIYAMCVGPIGPADLIDHVDLNPANNHPSNLRVATQAQNVMNRKCRRDNQWGLKGVSRQKKRFHASIRIDGAMHHLGAFSTPEAAHAAYAEAAHNLFGAFARPT